MEAWVLHFNDRICTRNDFAEIAFANCHNQGVDAHLKRRLQHISTMYAALQEVWNVIGNQNLQNQAEGVEEYSLIDATQRQRLIETIAYWQPPLLVSFS